MKTNGELTDRQQRILDFVRTYKARHGLAPGIRDIMGGVGITSTSVIEYNLKGLEKAGALRIMGGKSRGIILSDEPAALAANLRAVIEEAAEDLDGLAAWVQEGPQDPRLIATVISARAEGLRAALQTAGVQP